MLAETTSLVEFFTGLGYEVGCSEDGAVYVKVMQGENERVCMITPGIKMIDQIPHAMLTFTTHMANLEAFQSGGNEMELTLEFLTRISDHNSLPVMDPFAIVLLTSETDNAENDCVVIRASLVANTDEPYINEEQIKLMLVQTELALASCEDIIEEYFETQTVVVA